MELSPNVFFVEDVPHSWLFPQVAAVIHHGGAGTTAAALRAGVPAVITPFAGAGDQVSWADLAVRLGVGPPARAIKQMPPEHLAYAIQECVNHPALRANAAALGQKIRAENGVLNAVALIEQYATKFSGHHSP